MKPIPESLAARSESSAPTFSGVAARAVSFCKTSLLPNPSWERRPTPRGAASSPMVAGFALVLHGSFDPAWSNPCPPWTARNHWHSVSSSAKEMLDERKAAILRAVVEEYISTAQPVGSAHVAGAPEIRVSSATVRNEMAVLEHEGYLTQPHTSAGRIPTDKGYRAFVDQLTEPGSLAPNKQQLVREFFAKAHGELEEMLQDTSRLLA